MAKRLGSKKSTETPKLVYHIHIPTAKEAVKQLVEVDESDESYVVAEALPPLQVCNEITIQAELDEVWDALVNPEKTKVYMFGCEAITDWEEGEILLWRAQVDGEAIDYVIGRVTEYEPYRSLSYTVFDPHTEMPNVWENYLHVRYELSELTEGEVQLKVTQGDYNTVAEGERRYQESYNNGIGWAPILDAIKQLVESEKA